MPIAIHWSARRWILTLVGLLWFCVLAWAMLEMFTPHYRVSPATTFVTGPLNRDGTVNFAAAINAANSQGVAPQDNAAVALLKILGAHVLLGTAPARTAGLAAMGISKLPQTGAFTSFSDYLMAADFGLPAHQPRPATAIERMRLRYQMNAAINEHIYRYDNINKPWKPVEHPWVARWLKSQQRVIKMVRAAADLPRYFSPFLRSRNGMLIYLMPPANVELLRDMLRMDALEKMGTGKSASAWRDIEAIRQLGVLVRQQRPTLIDLLISLSGQAEADELIAKLAATGISSEHQLRAYLAESKKWPIAGGLRASINFGDRLTELNFIQGLFEHQNLIAARQHGFRGFIPLHFGQGMAQYNRWINQFVAALRPAAYAVRRRAIMNQTTRIIGESPRGWRGILIRLNVLHDMLTQMMPDFSQALRIEYAVRARQALSRVALALAAYSRKHGGYPVTLSRLVPHFFTVIPADPFTGRPLHYTADKAGYLLYSIGPNLRDDHGFRAPQTYPPNPDAPDDIAVHVHWHVVPQARPNGKSARLPAHSGQSRAESSK